ncbi:MAG: hypothetical protein ACI9DC_001426 [Gammaproteobacteria bacterium]|jgi:hypothetical protein
MISRIRLLSAPAGLLLLFSSVSANAVVVTVADWFVGGVDDGSADFRITEIFTSAAKLGGSDNRYEYGSENLTSDLTAVLFRMSNPNADPRTSMSGPTSWAERVGAQNFIWETAVPRTLLDRAALCLG